MLSLGMNLLVTSLLLAQDPSIKSISVADPLPYGQESIDYFSVKTQDDIAHLQTRLDTGEITLKATSRYGYLESLLKELKIPPESQLLVYSKTARNPALVSPKSPRAIYFNDRVSVAWIPTARELEITAIDPVKGANFYALSQPLENDTGAAKGLRFRRDQQCLSCHAGRSSLEIPGWLRRAFQTDASGQPIQGYSVETHEQEYARRWGGWFVTGAPAGWVHLGNLLSKDENERQRLEPSFRSAVSDLQPLVDISRYLHAESDVIAQLVFDHQSQGINWLIRVGQESRLARRSNAEELLVKYLVFADEPAFPVSLRSKAERDSSFAEKFQLAGATAGSKQSLRELDLDTRLFRYRLSYLIQHPVVAAWPNDCRDRVFRRLWGGLTSNDPQVAFSHIPASERAEIVKIVRREVAHRPDWWE